MEFSKKVEFYLYTAFKYLYWPRHCSFDVGLIQAYSCQKKLFIAVISLLCPSIKSEFDHKTSDQFI